MNQVQTRRHFLLFASACSAPILRARITDNLHREITWEIRNLETFFQVRALFRYYPDHTAPNAMAERPSRYSLYDGVVHLGVSYLNEKLSAPEFGPSVLIWTLGHEMAHVLQFRQRLDVTQARMELHADYLAGYYMGRQMDLGRKLSPNRVVAAMRDMGSDDHGSGLQRNVAFVTGLEDRNLDLEAAYPKGLVFAGKLLAAD